MTQASPTRTLPVAADILPLRMRADIRRGWLKQRLTMILPELMQRTNIDVWLVIAREYNEDPVIMSLLPEPSMSARRRTILMFTRQADGNVECISFDRYGFAGFYERGWDPDTGEGQYACLARMLRERDPQCIGLNVSKTFAFSDGLSHTEYEQLAAALGPELMARTVSAEALAVGWLERRLPAELEIYPSLVDLGHRIIAEAFSARVIRPGITSTEDVVWWMRQTMHDLGVQAWFQPSISIQAAGQSYEKKDNVRTLIQAGDLLHCDMGFYYLGLATDQQQHAYVLRPGEQNAPQGLQDALAAGNRLQDILMQSMQLGLTGNQVLLKALEHARNEGLEPSIYTHPLGYHGHAAGPTIGLWDQQQGVAGAGDYALFDYTCYSIELNVKHAVPEWNQQKVQIALEEDALLAGGEVRFLSGRQTQLHIIPGS